MGPAKMVTDGLVLHLDAGNTKSYPGSGTVWTDLSQTAITGSLTNGPTFSSTNAGRIFFDGTDDYIDLGNPSFSNITSVNNFTINVYFNAATGNNGRALVHKGATGFDYDHMIYISNNSTTLTFYKKNAAGTGVTTTGYGISSGSNINYCVVLSNDVISEYKDGILQVTSSITGDIRTTSNILKIGRGWEGSYSGSIYQVQIYNRALSANEVFQNYEATRERFNRPTIVTDDDARNFLNSANISSETQQRAVNDLVVDMKNAGLWNKMKAIYPFVGGTATTHKWNLKDPRDLDAAFRLTFSGGWTHSSNGALPNGTTGYANTFLSPATQLTNNSTHLTYYSRTDTQSGQAGGTTGTDIGTLTTYTSPIPLLQLVVKGVFSGVASTISSGYVAAGNVTVTASLGTGFFIGTRTSSTTHKLIKDLTILGTDTLASSNFSSLTFPFFIAARNDAGSPYQYSNKQAAFISIGDGLTDTDAANLYTIVQKYQTTLGRQV